MAWITTTPETLADGQLRDAYLAVRAARGQVASIWQAHCIHPEVMTAHLELYGELMFGLSELTRAERETLALAISATNRCRY